MYLPMYLTKYEKTKSHIKCTEIELTQHESAHEKCWIAQTHQKPKDCKYKEAIHKWCSNSCDQYVCNGNLDCNYTTIMIHHPPK